MKEEYILVNQARFFETKRKQMMIGSCAKLAVFVLIDV